MSKTISVSCNGTFSYSIEIRHDFSDLLTGLAGLGYDASCKICILSDSNIAPLYLKELQHLLEERFSSVTGFVFEAGESSKNMDTVEKIYEHLILHGFDRHDVLIALGGGVTGDMTGFAAATYLRGIDFVQIPTSLLAQVDSSIGGKTGVDFKQYKNMIGAFYQPKLVYMNLSLLGSLPERQLSSGMAELLKHGLIKDKAYFDWMNQKKDEIFSLKPQVIEELIFQSCEIKREIVEKDPTEKGERALLNFGHTIGHAVEKLSNFTLYHGECVSIGMVSAAYLSMQKGGISKEEFAYIKDTLRGFKLPTSIHGPKPDDIVRVSKSDKKMRAGRINFILLNGMGNAYIYRDFTDRDILEAIRYVAEEA